MKYIHPRRYLRRLFNPIKELFCSGINWRKTIVFNFHMLPYDIAKHLPILLYGKVDISHCTGKIQFLSNEPIKRGSWIIGQSDCMVNGLGTHYDVTWMAVEGTLLLGNTGRIANGCRISVLKGATLTMGNGVLLNANGRISCYESIIIGNKIHISWDGQIYDTDFHYVISDNGIVRRRSKSVSIGDGAWIGHNVTICKGAAIGKGCIVASHSLLNKDFGEYQNCIFAGIPAVLVKEGYKRIYNQSTEYNLMTYFTQNKDVSQIILNNENFIF